MNDVATGQTVKRNVWDWYGLRRLANETAIFVAPQGISNGWGNANGEDLTFTDNMVKAISDDLCVDTTQIFTTGFSYGGLWSHTLACQRASTFRAAAILDGAGGACTTGGQTGVLIVHGISDGSIPIASARTLRESWVAANGCAKAVQDPPEPRPA
jgi:poly(3-hydroxybutyrate) depolymerase